MNQESSDTPKWVSTAAIVIVLAFLLMMAVAGVIWVYKLVL